jgi:5-(carboxyamino)imidazole ribonucleotide synthase
MLGEQAHEANATLVVLAAGSDDPASAVAAKALRGEATNETALRELADNVDVITFDHELVDLDLLTRLENEGVVMRPSPHALRFAVDKAFQRTTLASWGLPVPAFRVLDAGDDEGLQAWYDEHQSTPVIKMARGGYDGRGVAFPRDRDEAVSLVREWGAHATLVLEESLTLDAEVAQMGVRGVAGDTVRYPVVLTRQADGMCVETNYPCPLAIDILATVDEVTTALLDRLGVIGLLAVEYFVTPRGVLINEVALRPHNTGHWTIEGTSAGQFVSHLHAVLGDPLPRPELRAAAVAMVNVVGGDEPSDASRVTPAPGLAVHDYRKAWRPSRKLGHVTAWGDDAQAVSVQAWEAARAFGTSTREAQ